MTNKNKIFLLLGNNERQKLSHLHCEWTKKPGVQSIPNEIIEDLGYIRSS